ncbi:F0F1 ATP synthase subunit gamma [Buchnera aphidicola (Pemphigus obesinymphae)]|uniref:F0F1 ATP synthase subunit gamma n=1 Tax=Buchnera aphidicola TaxID=9 RepID=UPI0022378BF7|nr:F0F1 ATP synthase subunit gamma [Buchnera aphidicola]MCW5196775.1 F0F1 ATP synthase subunit gamma [Buchnera aphidicola (Pemphigus obesinymphae)]
MVAEKEIYNKISSIKNTKKITKAMEMVAVSKMRKTVQRMQIRRPYSSMIKKIINHLVQGNLEHKHIYLEKRTVKRIGLIIISTDRGLCGSLNTNLFKKALIKIKKYSDKNVISDLIIFGLKGFTFFNKYNSNIIASVKNSGDKPSLSHFIHAIKITLKLYKNKSIDKLFLASNEFNNTMVYTPMINQLLPLLKTDTKKEDLSQIWDYLYEPNSNVLLDFLLNRYVESQIYQGILENIASEQAARMMAMKMATDNSGKIIKELKLIYNKTRQASITRELTEIISGAAAVSLT